MSISSHFPITSKITYLNTAACGLISNEVYQAKNKDNYKLFHNAPAYLDEENNVVMATKTLISKIFNADVNTIAITPNFSVSFNHILDGLNSNLTVLSLAEDYPSLLLPIKKRGFNLTTIGITSNIEEKLYSYITKNSPDVFALSITQFLNGIHIKPSFLKKLKSDFPNLIILADATQYLGVEDFDFKDSKIDAVISSCYKWLNAGFGNCIVLLSDELKHTIDSKTVGANSLIDKTKTAMKGMGFLEPGHYDLNSIKSLHAALQLHYNTIGIDVISEQIQDVSQLAFKEFKALDLLDVHSSKRAFHSSIFNLNLDEKYLDTFQNQDIYVSKRGNGLRISFHHYNTREDLEHLLSYI